MAIKMIIIIVVLSLIALPNKTKNMQESEKSKWHLVWL